MTTRPTVLFVCYQNAGRSRMAEAYLELLAGDRYQAPPAGLEPTEHTHPEAIQVMAEEGIAVEDRRGELLTKESAAGAVRVVAMNCSVGDLPVPVESWEMEEGPGDKLERTRAQRDTIRQHIAQLIKDLDRELQPGS